MNLFELFVKIGVDDQASEKIDSLSNKFKKGLTTAVTAADTAIIGLGTAAINSYSEFEQLAGGAAKIFDEMSQADILRDAQNAYKDLGLSANQYLAVINDVGATFAATMGDEAGYEAAKTGLKAISDYASGTGKNVDELSQKFTLITRSTSSYQSIADQFSGILPATSAGFLEQAQAAGILSDSYTQLTEVPIDEYQAAVSKMLEQGVADLGLANNTVMESETTISGSFAAMKAAADNFLVALVDDNANVGESFRVLASSVGSFLDNVIPKIWDFIGSLGPVGPLLAGITAALGTFQVAVSISKIVGAAAAAFDAYKKANEGATVAQWLMNAAMNANPIVLVVTLIAGLVAAIITLWNTNEGFRNALISAWEAIESAANKIFTSVANFFKETIPNAFNSVIDWFKNVGKKFEDIGKNIVTAIGNGIKSLASNALAWARDLINNFISGIKSLISKIMDAGKNVVNAVGDGIKSLASEALTWGKDMIDNFVSGIKSKISAVTSAVSRIASTVRSFLGFSEPEKGPLSNFHTYAPDMMDLFIKGIKDNEKKLTDQIEKTFDFGERTITAGISYRSYGDGRFSNGSGYGAGQVSVVQNIYSEAKTAADLMQEALYQQERAVLLGV